MSKRTKDEQVLSAFDGYDEGVRLLLEESERRAEENRLSPEERKRLVAWRRKQEEKKRKAKAKAEAQKANRVLTYLPTSLREMIESIAEREGVSMAQVITFFLFEAVEQYENQKIGFWGCKHASDSPRYNWILVHPKDTERTEKVASRKNKFS